jgi:FKBP-type peptidyl-prolyl cis-trans isomerase (trigger factor)
MYKDFPKLEKGNDVVFTIVVTVMPEFKLGNLKKIKIEKKEAKVTEKEITEALENLQKEQKTKEKEINDEWAKEISKMLNLENIKELKDLKKLIKDSLRAQKEHIILHENQDKALEEAVKISKIKIPEEAVKYEALERERTFAEEMKQRGVDIKDFMKMQNLTIEKMREMWSRMQERHWRQMFYLRYLQRRMALKLLMKSWRRRSRKLKGDREEKRTMYIPTLSGENILEVLKRNRKPL